MVPARRLSGPPRRISSVGDLPKDIPGCGQDAMQRASPRVSATFCHGITILRIRMQSANGNYAVSAGKTTTEPSALRAISTATSGCRSMVSMPSPNSRKRRDARSKWSTSPMCI